MKLLHMFIAIVKTIKSNRVLKCSCLFSKNCFFEPPRIRYFEIWKEYFICIVVIMFFCIPPPFFREISLCMPAYYLTIKLFLQFIIKIINGTTLYFNYITVIWKKILRF